LPRLGVGALTGRLLGHGRPQEHQLARRALMALGVASTSEVMEWTCARKTLRGQRRRNWDDRAARRALDQIGAVRIGRARTTGRPIIWHLKDTLSSSKPNSYNGLADEN
jgi:hypothetical protein